jgi:hypothetical protein
MKLDIIDMLTKSVSPVYGIVPGNAAIPLGLVVLPVIVGVLDWQPTKGSTRGR